MVTVTVKRFENEAPETTLREENATPDQGIFRAPLKRASILYEDNEFLFPFFSPLFFSLFFSHVYWLFSQRTLKMHISFQLLCSHYLQSLKLSDLKNSSNRTGLVAERCLLREVIAEAVGEP